MTAFGTVDFSNAATEAIPEDDLDRAWHAKQARLTGGLSPASLALAMLDWAVHLGNLPVRRAALAQRAWLDAAAIVGVALGVGEARIEPAKEDHRFTHPGWRTPPFAILEQGFLRAERWWQAATTDIPGVTRANERIVSFMARQTLDMLAPSNIPACNPEVIEMARRTHGRSLVDGLGNLIEDLGHDPALPMRPGEELAMTPGRVVFRNRLFELIRYAPTTDTVRPEPVLIVPAWIMKYYILDLRPEDSLIRYLIGQGFAVFCMSWRNPDATMRDVGLDDYRTEGVMAALDAIGAPLVHAVGYCLGGTLLSIAAAAMARDGDKRIATMTLFAAQTDFSEAGELQLFITESQLAFLDDLMWKQGYLDASQMAGAFQMLRSNDLIWSRLLRRYWLGEQEHPNDMMSWNQDATRMPYRMHAQYLDALFLNDDLAHGRLQAGGHRVSVGDIAAPFFVVGTETDHIAPWRSVHKIHLLNRGEVTFVLTSGGHNAGIVSEPGHKGRHYRISKREPGGHYAAPAEWLDAAVMHDGSWWPEWTSWLAARSGTPVPAPPMPQGLCAAPGSYVHER